MERLKAQLSELEKPVTQFVKDRETQAVKEFAEELKRKYITIIQALTVIVRVGTSYLLKILTNY